jgi:hypothetical protein
VRGGADLILSQPAKAFFIISVYMPAARGADAEVPVCAVVQILSCRNLQSFLYY